MKPSPIKTFAVYSAFTAVALLTFSSCSDGLPKYVLLGDLRVLAIKADPPEIAPGASSTITPWLSDIKGAGRTLTVTAVGCVDPGIGFGADASCDGRPDATSLTQGSVNLSGPEFTGATSSFSVTVPTDILQSRLPFDQFNGVAYLIQYTVSASDGSTVKSLKRVMVSNSTSPNSNPSLTQILADGAAFSTRPANPVQLQADFPATGPQGPENYSRMQVDANLTNLTETFVTTWFISEGTVQYERTDGATQTKFTPAATSTTPATRLQVIAVLRDGRGGEDIKAVSLP